MHRWMQLLGVTEERKALLEGAEHVHQFVRDVDETDDRMSDKVLYMHTYVTMLHYFCKTVIEQSHEIYLPNVTKL